MKHSWLCALVLSVGIVAVRPAFAQDPVPGEAPPPNADEAIDAAIEAKKRYAAGQKSVAQRQFVEAALHFEAAHSYAPSGVALIGAAIAWESANLPQRAADAYARSLDEPGLRKPQIAHAKARLEALERSIATIAVSGEDGIRVQLDDNVDVPLPARLHGSPGVHRLTVWSKGKILGRRDMFLRLARIESTVVPWRDDAPTPPPLFPLTPVVLPRPAPVVDVLKIAGGALLGAGVAAAAGGLMLQLSAGQSRSNAGNAATPESAASFRSNADTTQSFALASWIAAGALAAGGITCLVFPRSSDTPALTVSPLASGGAMVSGNF